MKKNKDMINSIIVSAPSGTGKTTILGKLFEKYPNKFSFSVSATTRKAREGEVHGKNYYFISEEEFAQRLANDEFLEYENVYEGLSYGTLKSEVERISKEGKIAIFDVDVKGGVRIKQQLQDKALAIFIMPPSIETLRERLLARGTETEDSLAKRLNRAEMEISYKEKFDKIIINDNLAKAVEDFDNLVNGIDFE